MSWLRVWVRNDHEDTERLESAHPSGYGVETRLDDTSVNLVIVAFDAMPDNVQTSVARHVKAFAEGIDGDDITFAFTVEEGGAVVRAEPDLRMRVQRFQVNQ